MKISERIAKAAKPRERDVRAELKKRVESYGGTVNAVKFLDENGAPDVLCQFPSHFLNQTRRARVVWVETKVARDGRLSVHQQTVIARLREAGQEVLVIAKMVELDTWLPELPW